jgi:predicted alpha/beta hydrolase family esterase
VRPGLFHRSLDAFAVWTEDRLRRAPEACLVTPAEPLACFGPLVALPETAPAEGPWSAPSPLPLHAGDRMHVRAARARGPRRGTALLVPPWKIARPGLVSGYAALLRRAGWDLWLVSPPHHLERTIAGKRSGEGFVSLDLARLRRVFEQLVLELRTCAALAAQSGPVALVGLSLGALAGALAATAPEPLAFAALVAPPHLPAVMAETGIGRRYQRLAALAGTAWPANDALSAALAPLDPALRAPTAARVLVASGSYDAIAPPEGPARLARAWGAERVCYPRGHISLLFLCRALRRDLAAFARSAAPARGAAEVARPSRVS